MKARLIALGLMATLSGLYAIPAGAADLRDAVPSDVYLATYHKHNPERDYQKAYFDQVWQTVEETQICERFLQAIQNQLDDDGLEKFDQVRDKLSEALDPVQWEALAECTESVYAQKMVAPTSQHLVLLRLPEGAAESIVAGITNLIKLVEEGSEGKVSLVTESVGDVQLNVMQLPPQAPFSPCVGSIDDVFLFASTRELAQQSIKLLGDPDAKSKFDDPRLAEALTHLPPFEDGLTFFDGGEMFRQLSTLSTFIRQVSAGDPKADRAAELIEAVFSEMDAFDYEVTVEYTEGYQNRAAVFGRAKPEAKEKLIGKLFADQQPFEEWSRWVPADATSYALTTGINLHPLYEWLMELIPAHFPEAQEGLDKFAELQDQYDLHLDEDFLQAFSGESVSITLPGTAAGPMGKSGQSVTFCRCEKPERIKELLHRLVETLQNIPQLQAQNIALEEVEGLDGFEEISAGVFAMVGVRPVVGFQDGWMVLGSHAEAVQKVLDTRAGNGESIAGTEQFTQFDLDVSGPVMTIRYTNLAENTRAMAQGIQQMGAMLQMIMGMAAQQGADLQAASEFFALLPSIGQIISKFDFFEAQLSVTQPGPDDLSYTRQSVILVRPPGEETQ